MPKANQTNIIFVQVEKRCNMAIPTG